MEEAEFAVVSSIFTLGGLLGALSAGPISTGYGRLLVMRISAIFYIIGSVLETVAPTITILSAGRLLSGVGAGSCLVVVPIYISEIAPLRERGLFGFMTQITVNVGLLLAQILGYYLSAASIWRIIIAAGAGLGILFLVGLFFIPESPAWTAAHKDPKTAIHFLQRIRGKGVSIDDEIQAWGVTLPTSDSEAEGLLSDSNVPSRRASSSSKTSTKSIPSIGFFGVVRSPLYRPAIIAVVGVMFAQQFTGINSVMMYSVSLLSDLFPQTSTLLTILISIVNLLATIAAAPLPDTLGRKRSILLSLSGLGISSLCLGFSILYSIQIFSAISVLFFVAFFAIGLGPIPFMLASELVATEAKGATQSWALASNWIGTFIVAQFFPIINTALGGDGLVYFGFAGIAVLSVAFVAMKVPETRGKRDADEVWGRTRRVD
jgi:sugar porter (SP) family MFS transporter